MIFNSFPQIILFNFYIKCLQIDIQHNFCISYDFVIQGRIFLSKKEERKKSLDRPRFIDSWHRHTLFMLLVLVWSVHSILSKTCMRVQVHSLYINCNSWGLASNHWYVFVMAYNIPLLKYTNLSQLVPHFQLLSTLICEE